MAEQSEIRGRLERLNVHASKNEFAIYSPTNTKGIVCVFDPEDASELGKHITKRINVYGRVKYDREGRPLSVRVSKWEPMPEDEDLPSIGDMLSYKFKISGGKDAQSIIEGLRGGSEY